MSYTGGHTHCGRIYCGHIMLDGYGRKTHGGQSHGGHTHNGVDISLSLKKFYLEAVFKLFVEIDN